MAIPTYTIMAEISDATGNVLVGAPIVIRHVGVGIGGLGSISPGYFSQVTDANGRAYFDLVSTTGDYSETYYEVTSYHPVTGEFIHNQQRFEVDTSDADLDDLLDQTVTIPPNPNQELLDYLEQARNQAVAAAAVSTTQASAATTAATEADTARDEVVLIHADVSAMQAIVTTAKNEAVAASISAGTSASSASASEANAATSEANAAGSAGTAATAASNAATSETNASGFTDSASSFANLAERWANEAENVPVTSGLYSAFHWAKKAELLVIGATEGAVLEVNGYIGPAVTLDYVDVGAASAAQGALADTAVQPGDLSTYVTVTVLTTTLDDYALTSALSSFYTKTESDARYLQNGAIEANAYVRKNRKLALAGL